MNLRKYPAAGRFRQAVLLTLTLPVLIATAGAVEVPTLYTAEVPYDRNADDPRGAAHRAALGEVLLRVSGLELFDDPGAFDELFPNPSAYVMQFRPGANDTLWVSFDGQAIEQVLRDAGLTFWGAERPLTLVWLAVDWGRGEREIVGADDPERVQDESRSIDRNRLLRERLLEVAARRGLPIAFPLLDTSDLQNVSFADVWGGFDDRILEASRRYDVNSVLIGRVRPATSQQSRWTYYFAGAEASMSGTPEVVVGRIADQLAAEFAIGGDTPVETVALNVSGVMTVEAYGRVQRMLKAVALIEKFAVTEVAGDRVTYRVDVRGGAERLSRALRFNGLVEQEFTDRPQPESTLEFYYSP